MRNTLLVAALALCGCGRSSPHLFAADRGEGETEGDLEAEGSTGVPSCEDAPSACVVELDLRRAVDILFVVDNSGSMGGEQGTLARSFGSFIQVLEEQQVGANYRIGVTNTSIGGTLRATSCRSRLDEFTFEWQFGSVDEVQRGCLDHCQFEPLSLSDPWVEKSSGTTNLPPGVTMEGALQCIGPQGVNGSGFEQPLEAIRGALTSTTNGFIRDDALLAVIFVTDEADCSGTEDDITWLQTSGSVFWTTPERATSGACWRAGTRCFGGPGTYGDCVAVDYDYMGNETTEPHKAILYSLERYKDTLKDIARAKQEAGGQGEVLVAAIAGVPIDYPQTGQIVYADSPFPDFNIEYGIGPGCDLGTETVNSPPGIPPVRLREFAEAFATVGRNVFSVCADDYGVALESIASAIGEVNERACVAGCVSDAAPTSPGLQPKCSLVERVPDDTPDRAVPQCSIDDTGWDFPSPIIDVCYRALTDQSDFTATPHDDMSAQCSTFGANVEFVLERREGTPVAAGTSVHVGCDLQAPVGFLCDDL